MAQCVARPHQSVDLVVVVVVCEFWCLLYLLCNSQIERVENRSLFEMFAMKRDIMIRNRSAGVTVERTLWHGTDVKALENICLYGFNRAYCGKNGMCIASLLLRYDHAAFSCYLTHICCHSCAPKSCTDIFMRRCS